jgi:phage tail sheath protein FI
MPEYLAPGVYVEEVSLGPRPIEGVSTSTTGMVGRTERGPMLPRLVTSWDEFYRWYGGYVDRVPGGTQRRFLPYAVRGFFDNGGQRLFVARVTAPGAVAATTNLAGNPGATTVNAIGRGLWGNNILLRVTPASAVDPNAPTAPTATWFRLTLLYFRDGIPNPFVDPTDISQLGNADRREPDAIEDYDNLSPVSTDGNFAQSVVNAASKLVNLIVLGRPNDVNFPAAQLGGGTDGTEEQTGSEYLGFPNEPVEARTALAGLAALRDISLLGIPDDVVLPNLRTEILLQCERQKDRFAIISCTNQEHTTSFAQLRPPQAICWSRQPDILPASTHALTPSVACTRHRRTRCCAVL